MRIIKKLDVFVVKKFLLLFVGSFFVCLLVFMMQFTWKFIDDLIGKGLTLDILAQFFWHMALTLTPTSIPLAVLLASLLTFGNMGESLELLSIKAAGVSLLRVMQPLIIFCMTLSCISFYFQNVTSPNAQLNLRSLLFSMRQTSPAVEIPEGVFYSGVPNVNLYVQQKNAETGMLYQVIIYKTDQGFERAQIVLADSARLEMTEDKTHLTLDLWNGEQFENLQANVGSNLGSIPYDRETFLFKHLIIDFDSNINLFDADMLRGQASAKDEWQISHDIDSIQSVLDSISRVNYNETFVRRLSLLSANSLSKTKSKHNVPFDSLIAQSNVSRINTTRANVSADISHMKMEYGWRNEMSSDVVRLLRQHYQEWHQKITLSLACLLFFFIGAPLGAAIGKGGLGLSTVISVIIFILYYIVNTSGLKLGRQGDIPIWIGMWASTFIMIPCGLWLTYKSQYDKLNININAIWNTIKRLPVWRLFQKPLKISVKGVWSSLLTMKTAKTKGTSSWLPKWRQRKP